MVRKIFELYETGQYPLSEIRNIVHNAGLRGRKGKSFRPGHIQRILKNSFYYGGFKFGGETYQGAHEPLISKSLFYKVQSVMKSRCRKIKPQKREHVFCGFISCPECGCMITAELQKGHRYYRCTKKRCPCDQKYLREESLANQINDKIREAYIPDNVKNWMLAELDKECGQIEAEYEQSKENIRTRIKIVDAKPEKLLDGYISGVVSTEDYLSKKEPLIHEKAGLTEKSEVLGRRGMGWLEPMKQFIKSCNINGKLSHPEKLEQQKDFLKKTGSNFVLQDAVHGCTNAAVAGC